MGIVPPPKGDRCERIGHFLDELSESEKLSEETESFWEDIGKNFVKSKVTED